MLDPIVRYFERLVDDFSWGRLSVPVLILFLAVFAIWMYEAYTHSFELNKLDRQIELLERLGEVKKSTEGSKELSSIYDNLAAELASVNDHKSSDLLLSRQLTQAFAALTPWVLMAVLIMLFSRKGSLQATAGMAVIAIPLSILGYWLPAFEQTWINYGLYPVGSFALVLVFIVWWQNARTSSQK